MNQLIINQSLLGALSQREHSVPVLSDGSRWWSVGEVIEAAREIRENYRQYEGKAIVLALSNKVEFILWLCALDGFASKILLASDGDLVSVDESILQSQHIAALIIDTGVKKRYPNISLSEYQLTKWCLFTSGTTATPKLIIHSLADLSSKITHVQSRSILRWGLLHQQSRFAGLQVILQALIGGGELVVSKHEKLSEIIKSFVELKVNAVSATPSYWRRILMTDNYKSLLLSQITLGGEIVDDLILQQLKKVFPMARIRHIYASTEAGVGFSVCDGKSGFPKKLLAANRLEIRDGCLWTTGFSLDNHSYSSMVNTGDLVELRGDRVYFLGREQGVINVGGNKVFPEAVEIKIRALEEVVGVRVFSIKNSIMGELVAADIVPAVPIDNETLFKQQLIAKMRKQLHKYEVPMLLFFKKEIELSHNTKVVRN